MLPASRTLAIVALTTTLISCSGQAVPATTPAGSPEKLHIHATTATIPLVLDLTTAYTEEHPLVSFDTRNTNYRSSLEHLLNGEIAYFLSNHLNADAPWAAPIGYDGIVVLAHPDVDVEQLTTEQLRAIYQGRITNWQQCGGQDQAITVFSRESGSGTRAEFERMVMGRRQTTLAAHVMSSSRNMLEGVQQTPGGIGYISIGYLADVQHPLQIDGVMASLQTVADSSYPLRSTLFVIGRLDPQESYRQFIGWIQSPQGQAVVARRYAPLN